MSSIVGIFQCPDGINPPELQIWDNAAFDNGESEDSAEMVISSSWWSNSLESNSCKENLSPVFEASPVSNSIKSSVSSIPIKPLQPTNVLLPLSRGAQVKDSAKEGSLLGSKKEKDIIDMEIEEIEKEIKRLSSRLEALRLAKAERNIIKSVEKRGRMVAAKFMEPPKQHVKIEEPMLSKTNRRGMSLGPAEILSASKLRGASLGPAEIVSGAKSKLLMGKQEMITPVSRQNRRKSCFWKLGEIDELKVAKGRGKSLSVSPKSRKNLPKFQPPKQAVTTTGCKRPVKKEDGVLAAIQPKMLFNDGEKSVATTTKKPVKPGRVVPSRYNQIAKNQSNSSFSEARKRSWPENDKEDVNKRRASRGDGVSGRMEIGRVKQKWEIPSKVMMYKGDAGEDSPPADELPKIRTNRCVNDTPRDSGAAKRVADLVGRKSYFCCDERDAAEESVCMALSFAEEAKEG